MFAGPIPIAILLIGAGIAAGPLLHRESRPVLGIVAIVVGFPSRSPSWRALARALSSRWLVFVPAGIALADPLTLIDPVLMRREDIVDLGPTRSTAMPEHALDLRLGTLAGGLAIELGGPVMFGRRRGRVDAEYLRADARRDRGPEHQHRESTCAPGRGSSRSRPTHGL